MWSISSTRKRSPIYLVDISEERARIARELHDGIAQELAAIGYALDSEIGRSDTSTHSRKSLRQIRERLTELNAKVRNEIYLLRNSRAMPAHDQLMQSLNTLPIEFTVTGTLPNTEAGLELFKTLQELARNAVEHGEASKIIIKIDATEINFNNDGSTGTASASSGFGIIGIVERLQAIGWIIIFEANFSQIQLRKAL